ncbi:MAG: sulfur carrier protein ThiS [Prevotellaceae bacterium]|jgi:sulfur carrier protein|nr:sulfur carrier protein ThiS [Prevotellaceae bacterium]
MTVLLNDKPYEVPEGTSLAAFIESLGLKREGIAVAIDYEVVPKDQWTKTMLSDQLELMLIQAVSGGGGN